MPSIWIADDDRSIRWVLGKALEREGVDYRLFEDAASVIQALDSEHPAVLVTDIRMPGMTGTDLLRRVKEKYPELPVIIMTAFGDLESAVTAFEGGAYEYLAKPFDITAAVSLIKRAGEEACRNGPKPKEQVPALVSEIVGQSPAMQELFRAIGRLSQSHVTVLITGESGTGKELVARALHRHSPRKNAPFIAINTAAIPADLLESELFGHEKGAFTGASEQRIGRFEQARGGTLFLDEIGDMPMPMQTKLLRVLSDASFYRVGGKTLVHADVRVIAATNQNLEERVREGLFREDLYHRLNVIRLRLPPLRDRPEDIPALAEHFLTLAAKSLKTEKKHLSQKASERIAVFPFPGNVRQLENLCNYLTVMAPSQVIEVEDLPAEFTEPKVTESAGKTPFPEGANWKSALREEVSQALEAGKSNVMDSLTRDFETVLYRVALDQTHGKRILAAKKLGVGRNTLTRKLKELGIADADT
ncbi:MAG: nitrogen regulation protein NR(I) [Sutterella sp.]|nr:nitrogen regulation protein NR(I) [Sutterella sp.]